MQYMLLHSEFVSVVTLACMGPLWVTVGLLLDSVGYSHMGPTQVYPRGACIPFALWGPYVGFVWAS